jgi:D-glycero-D-manno-heptose 1,7-bisphosphate phosphatase
MKLAIVDRDGTIIDVVRDEETGAITVAFHPNHIHFLAGAIEGLRTLASQGFTLAVATNQPGPAKGQFSREAVQSTNDALVARLMAEGITIARVAVCMHHPDGGDGGDATLKGPCTCRKPKSGMLIDLMRDLGATPESTWMIGDSQADVDAARGAKVRAALVFPMNRCELCPLRTGPRGMLPDVSGATLVEVAKAISAF